MTTNEIVDHLVAGTFVHPMDKAAAKASLRKLARANTKWVKRVPISDGSYWCRWKGKNDWRTTVATITTLGMYGTVKDPVKYDKQGRSKYDRIIAIEKAGTLCIHRGKTEKQARAAFDFKEALFWTQPIIEPPPPPSHRAKSKAK